MSIGTPCVAAFEAEFADGIAERSSGQGGRRSLLLGRAVEVLRRLEGRRDESLRSVCHRRGTEAGMRSLVNGVTDLAGEVVRRSVALYECRSGCLVNGLSLIQVDTVEDGLRSLRKDTSFRSGRRTRRRVASRPPTRHRLQIDIHPSSATAAPPQCIVGRDPVRPQARSCTSQPSESIPPLGRIVDRLYTLLTRSRRRYWSVHARDGAKEPVGKGGLVVRTYEVSELGGDLIGSLLVRQHDEDELGLWWRCQ